MVGQQKLAFDGLETVRDFIRWAYSRFNEAELFYGHGSDNGWDEAVHLVLQSLHLPWDIDQRVLDSRLTLEERTHVADLVSRRVIERIPSAYLVNQAWFCGLPFYVDERVLVPRSPIAELIDQHFQPWLGEQAVSRVLDMCTGSGCIGIAAAYAFPEAEVVLSDIDHDALQVATINIDKHELDDRVTAIEADLFQGIPLQLFDIIVSNPPYVDAEDLSDMPPEFHHEPEHGLASGEDGLFHTLQILAQAADYLTEQGLLIVEVGNSQWALQDKFPQVPFNWLAFEHGGDGVFLLEAEQCRQFQADFKQALSDF
ncbi:50S ribosomal protein L3 N(5)-glutamine methyltransferase [Zooshikella harenae]|uniref:Ribosomal protein uL3 glutamine methyltransferase n=1 Tax=Zooshikella harenae TaxID=2827238 RepID=A0ABS5ZEQ8_9GAMM|nr:50S ribosomal protein L3 N(5)-glutamine methyltransferase [Zooshikella harenae]MBU2712475.1 50S ribosomal protein L3 N(5)-glutamine methyltransferase [Zooshikella harenae]